MPVLKAGEPFVSEVPELAVDSLPVGSHKIRLVVQDNNGNASDPVFAEIIVTRVIRTGPIIDTGPVRTGPVIDPGPVRTGPVVTPGPIVTPSPIINRIISPETIVPERPKAVKKTPAKRKQAPKKKDN
jgi:hypothetical protein